MTTSPETNGQGGTNEDIFVQIGKDSQRVKEAIEGTTSPLEIRRLLEEHEAFAERLAEEFEGEFGRQHGFETLTTNRRGGRSTEWFDQTGKYFSLGYATLCVAVGIVHEDIGMAGSHRNTITVDNMFDEILRERAKRAGLVLPQDRGTPVKEKRLYQTVARAATEAVEEFALLADGRVPETPVFIVMYGMSETPPELLPACETTILNTIRDHPVLADFGGTHRTALGIEAELAYGGKNHPRYPNPTLVG